MANATKKHNVVINLELTLEEALALKVVADKIGGCPTRSTRKYMDGISNALQSIGIIADDLDGKDLTTGHCSNITFIIDSHKHIVELANKYGLRQDK